MPKQTIRDLDLSGRKVLVRVDFNVPQTKDGAVSDDRRIRAALPTLNYALEHGASLVLVSHLGRPSGKPEEDAPFKMDRVAARLQEVLGRPVTKVDDTVGPAAQAACAALQPGGVVVLENVRFNKGEKKGDPQFAAALAGLADAYVNDAFGTCHRDEASMVAVPECFPPERRGIGFLVEKELQILETLLGQPRTPMVAVMGGAKVSDKILVIENLLPKVDQLLIGGAMTYTFLKAQGHSTGKSRVEADKLDEARHLLELAGSKLVLPQDHLVTTALDGSAPTSVVTGSDLPEGVFGIDIGPATIAALRRHHPPRGDGGLERPDGQVRGRAVPPGDARGGPGPGGVAGRDRHRRRRDCRGRRAVRLCRARVARFDRRRRLPRMPRRKIVQLAEGHTRS